jgi:hypothetical protein
MDKDSGATQHIVEYLKEDASVGNTLESIVTRWMAREPLNAPKGVVLKALEQLRNAGAVSERKTQDGRTMYFVSEEHN